MKKTKPYHHGNLRETLLRAAIGLVGEVGPTAFTLREVARRAGVSHNAPYRHFRDKEDLIRAVAAEGYGELTSAMIAAAARQARALDRLKHAGLAYIDFALRRPEHFTVMFDAPISKRKHPDSAAAGDQTFETLLGFAKSCQDAERLPFRSNAEVLKFGEFVIDQSLPVSR